LGGRDRSVPSVRAYFVKKIRRAPHDPPLYDAHAA
jgi:hypothetical protein